MNAASIIAGAIGGKSITSLVTKKNKAQIMAGAIGGNSGNSSGSAPIDNSHSHSNKDASTGSVGTPPPPSNTPPDLPEPSFMGKGQVEQFSGLTDTSSVDRGGRAMSPDTLDPVGIKPAMNPPMATPIKDVDREGTMNALYS